MISRRILLAAGVAAASPASVPVHAQAAAPDVIIVGGGLAGLNAALLLEEQGLRVGGRVMSLPDVPGTPEAGANVIGRGYARLVDRAERLGVALRRTDANDPAAAGLRIALGGRLIEQRLWEGDAANPFAGRLRTVPPWVAGAAALRALNPLKGPEDWRAPEFARLDVAVAELLRPQGWNDAALHLGFGINPGYARDAADLNALMAMQIQTSLAGMIAAGPGIFGAVGGNDRIPSAMAGALKTPVRFGVRVAAVEVDSRGADVRLADGKRLRARAVVMALPAPALRRVAIRPALPPGQARAIESLPYNAVTQVHFAVERVWWGQSGPGMWTDTLAGRLFPVRNGSDGEVSSLLAFVSGRQAKALDALPEAVAMATVQTAIEALQPEARGALRPLRLVRWGKNPLAGGAYACWAPGQIMAGADVIGLSAGRLVFAGEHTARVARGMEAAMESGERAAIEVLGLL